MTSDDTWRKSRRSQNDQNCVEVRCTLDELRDSKNQDGPTLRANVLSLVQTVKAETWRKSRRSQNGANCVEVRCTLDELRDSKNQEGPTLRADVASLVRAVKAGFAG